MNERPSPVRTDTSNAFAHDTVRRRLPTIARETAALNPDYAEAIAAALETLARDLETDAPIREIADAEWTHHLRAHDGDSWLNTEWFFAETYFYRLILEAVDWNATKRDPFAPKKLAEIQSDALRNAMWTAAETLDAPPDERLNAGLTGALWGNRTDLSYTAAMEHGAHGGEGDLLVDDRAAVVAHLRALNGGVAHLVADNTGTELAMDLLLIDMMLDLTALTSVTLHVKARPTFVSDATRDDALTLLAEMGGRGGLTRGFAPEIAAAAERLQGSLLDGRLTLQADPFWNSGTFLSAMPAGLHEAFSEAVLVIFKGDANYRRLIRDTVWETTLPFADVTDFFPSPLLAMRALKSDPIVGLEAGQAEALDAEDPRWRVNGKRGIIQFR